MRHKVALSIAAAAAVVVTLLLAFGVGATLELPTRDLAMRVLPSRPAEATVVVAIDEASLRSVGAWPWSRERIAALIDRAADGGAKAVIVDVLLAEARPGDAVLARAMRRIPTIAVAVLDERGEWLLPAPALADASTPAHGNFELDHDGILRRLATTKQSRDRALTAVSVEAASIVTSAAVPIGRSIAPAFRTPPRAIPQRSAATLASDGLRGKLVFIGPTALALGDRVLTPASRGALPDPGVTVHAAATESLVRGESVRELAPIAAGCMAGLAVGLIVNAPSRVARLAFAGSSAAVVIAGGLIALAAGVAVPFVTLLGSVAVATAAVEIRESRLAVTDLEQLATKLAEHRARDVESKRLLAHELQTPLASMRGLTQLLGGYELTDAERRRVASLLEAEAGKLQSMVHVLLDLERLPLRDFDASSSVVSLGDVVGARVDFLRASTERELTRTIDRDVFVRADAALLERVVDNLVGNAFKYAPAPAPVSVRVARQNGEAVLEVEDRGPGIAPAERERIFQRFFRGTTAGGTQGLGLGLALVAEVARWHGGNVSLETPAGGGSRFRVILPAAEATS